MKQLVLNTFSASHSRRALLVFHAAAFLPTTDIYRHSGLLLTRTLAEALDDMGYVVDVADQNVSTGEKYNLVVDAKCHLYQGVRRDCPRIFLAVQRADQNERVIERYRAMNERRGTNLQPVGLYPPCAPLDSVSQIIVVGNDYTAESWRAVYDGRVACINNVAYPDIEYVGEKDWEIARRSFLFFAGKGPVHKGLDLLLEVFTKHPELNLYVCQQSNAAFHTAYWKELHDLPNVNGLIGWVPVDEKLFHKLAYRCGYIIHPSCSEGQAGAVVQGMAAGLIPLISRESGVDLGITNYVSPSTLGQDVIKASQRWLVDLTSDSKRYHKEIDRDYSPAAVKAQFRRALEPTI